MKRHVLMMILVVGFLAVGLSTVELNPPENDVGICVELDQVNALFEVQNIETLGEIRAFQYIETDAGTQLAFYYVPQRLFADNSIKATVSESKLRLKKGRDVDYSTSKNEQGIGLLTSVDAITDNEFDYSSNKLLSYRVDDN